MCGVSDRGDGMGGGRGSERRIGEGKRPLRFDVEPFPVELVTLEFMCPVGTPDLR